MFQRIVLLGGVIVSALVAGCGDRNATAHSMTSTPPPVSQSGVTSTLPAPNSVVVQKTAPERLIALIQSLQAEHVRDSYGLEGGQCFTAMDLKKFQADRVPAQIVARLRSDTDFIAIVNGLKSLPPTDRSALLARARATYKKTWADLGLDPRIAPADALRKGQTDAGQEAERSIARAVVDLVATY